MSEQNETRQLILDSAQKIFADYCDKALLDAAEKGEFPEAFWNAVCENGFSQLGGAQSGTDAQDLFAVAGLGGQFAVPVPLADTMLVNRWLGAADGLFGIGILEGDRIHSVPWGRRAQKVVGVQRGSMDIVVVDSPELAEQGVNLAGEPRDTVLVDAAHKIETLEQDPFAQVAVIRINQMAGSLQALLDLGIQFASERIQFGRAISKFQAIQHSLAIVASEVAAARRAADAAVDGLGTQRFVYEVAASKSRVGEAVTIVAEQVHQIHGAMGFTHEHRLHHFSRRAWSWRDEFGNEFYWQGVLGRHIANLGADQAWQFIATRG